MPSICREQKRPNAEGRALAICASSLFPLERLTVASGAFSVYGSGNARLSALVATAD
jgi:hypothetical protein